MGQEVTITPSRPIGVITLMEAAIVIPVYNRREVTLACLKAIYEDLPAPFTVIVADSGSTDGTREAVTADFPQAILVQGDEADWWASATNRGVRLALERGSRYVVTYNDDNIATAGLFARLYDDAAGNPGAIVSATVCYLDARDKVMFAGRRRSGYTDRFIQLGLNAAVSSLEKGLREVDLLHGMCTIFPVSVFRDCGVFDDQSFPHLFADDDLALKARARGYRLLVDHEAIVYNDHTKKGLTPYARRLRPREVISLFVSRRSVFQVTTRSAFYWRHRRSLVSYSITMVSDYCRLLAIVLLRWMLPQGLYSRVESAYSRIRST